MVKDISERNLGDEARNSENEIALPVCAGGVGDKERERESVLFTILELKLDYKEHFVTPSRLFLQHGA